MVAEPWACEQSRAWQASAETKQHCWRSSGETFTHTARAAYSGYGLMSTTITYESRASWHTNGQCPVYGGLQGKLVSFPDQTVYPLGSWHLKMEGIPMHSILSECLWYRKRPAPNVLNQTLSGMSTYNGLNCATWIRCCHFMHVL